MGPGPVVCVGDGFGIGRIRRLLCLAMTDGVARRLRSRSGQKCKAIFSRSFYSRRWLALSCSFIPKEQKDAIRWIANLFSLAGLLVSIPLGPWFWAQRFEP